MAIASRESLSFAVKCIARHGDTDVFPFPLENHWLHDDHDTVVATLGEIDKAFEEFIADYPVTFVKNLVGVGYTGFRAATQVDPIWNAYLLGLTLELAPEIEAHRVPQAMHAVFSYRLSLDSSQFTMFNPDFGWGSFQQAALEQANSAE